VNRISIGAQSFQQEELDFLGRMHSVESIKQAVNVARNAGFRNVNLDLIFAIPGSTLDSLEHNIHSVLQLKPEHISAYSLTYEKNTPLQRACRTGEIVVIDEETDRSMYELVIDELTAAGLEQYEISNFARPDYRCQHNLTYWANTQYIGIGPGATSYYKGKRYTNVADIEKYVQATGNGISPIAESHTSTPIETACQTAVLNLRRIEGINLGDFKTQTGFDLKELFGEPISQNLESGLLKEKTDANGIESISLTRSALPIADTVLCDFSMV
jgi:oxygen-independent coproporphyrinogen-3 oxidase